MGYFFVIWNHKLIVLDRNNWHHTAVFKLFVLNRNFWNDGAVFNQMFIIK